jgi:flavin reductase (DIM6/NTAB) family NADH-FMN oxidoreductase RutF
MAVESQVFKEVMAHWATGVTVVTTQLAGHPVGITASSFTSLSLEPPQILICVNKKLSTNEAIRTSGYFAVNILTAGQQDWGEIFAGMRPGVTDRFAGIDWAVAVTGAPILPGVLAWLDCRVGQLYDGADHTIFVGEVLAGGATGDGAPLLYYHRNWQHLADEA